MQFYMIHEDSYTSAKYLPDYAIFQVNPREGWQMLSDIGHMFGVTWEGQNKLYSLSHAKTLSFCSSRDAFDEFLQHYMASLNEYFSRKGKLCYWDMLFCKASKQGKFAAIREKLPKSKYHQTVRYLTKVKKEKQGKKITEHEVRKMQYLWGA